MAKNLNAIDVVTSNAKTDKMHINQAGTDKAIIADNISVGMNLPVPWIKKYGLATPISNNAGTNRFAGQGLLDINYNGLDAELRATDVLGHFLAIQTAATTGANVIFGPAGEAQGENLFTRSEHCMLKIKLRLESLTGVRFFFGFDYDSFNSPYNTDDMLNGSHGFALCKITTQANWQIGHNDGTGATVYENTGIAIDDSNPHIWILRAKLDATGFEWNYDGGAFTSVTTEIPGIYTPLGPNSSIVATENFVKGWSLYWIYAENDT